MKGEQPLISPRRLYSIRAQGYCDYSDENLSELAFGNRFAYYLCSFFLLSGVISANIPILSAMTIVMILGVILPNHPFDYIYNNLLSKPLHKPKLPRRSKQLKFACLLSTIWLAITIYLFYTNLAIAGYVSGGVLFSIAFLVSTTDFCIPSVIYNFLFKYQVK
jgi:hypothetical protein